MTCLSNNNYNTHIKKHDTVLHKECVKGENHVVVTYSNISQIIKLGTSGLITLCHVSSLRYTGASTGSPPPQCSPGGAVYVCLFIVSFILSPVLVKKSVASLFVSCIPKTSKQKSNPTMVRITRMKKIAESNILIAHDKQQQTQVPPTHLHILADF